MRVKLVFHVFPLSLPKLDIVEHLVKKFNMTNIDAMVAYEKFFKKYPNGEINKEQFMEVRKTFILNTFP